jgi:hypothetical protein
MHGLLPLAAVALFTVAQEPTPAPARYGVDANLEFYPQATPKEALRSVVKAIQRSRADYLLAHLTDPEFVDRRVQKYGGRFSEVVTESSKRLADDPEAVKELERFSKSGEWQEAGDTASVKLPDVPRQVYLHKVGDRWYLENRQRAAPPSAE